MSNIELERQREIEQRLHCAIRTLAMMRAKAIVRDAHRRQGHKLSLIPSAQITAQAKVYFTAHYEALIAHAIPIVEEWLATGFFGKRAQWEWEQRDRGANVINFVKNEQPKSLRCAGFALSGAK